MLNYFNFKSFGDQVLITNDFGHYCFLSQNDFSRLADGTICPDDSRYQELKDKCFLFANSVSNHRKVCGKPVISFYKQDGIDGNQNIGYEPEKHHIPPVDIIQWSKCLFFVPLIY